MSFWRSTEYQEQELNAKGEAKSTLEIEEIGKLAASKEVQRRVLNCHCYLSK